MPYLHHIIYSFIVHPSAFSIVFQAEFVSTSRPSENFHEWKATNTGWKKQHIPQMVVNKWWFTIAESIRISLTKSKWWFPSSESLLDSNVSAPFSGEKNPSLLRNSPPVNQRRTKLWFRRSFSLIDFQVPAVKIVKSLRNEEKNHLNQTSIFWIPSPLVFGESVNFHVTKHHVTNFPIVFMAQETHLHQRWAEILTPDSKHWKKMFWPIKYDVLDI